MTGQCRAWKPRPRAGAQRLLVAALLLLTLAGCRSARQELLEIELRDRERELEQLKAKQSSLESDYRALELELEALQRKLAKEQQPAASPSGAIIFVKRITLGRLSGGYRKDPKATFDDALQVLIEPRDADDAVVKAPGSVRIEVFEVSPQGIKTPLSHWELTARELRGTWDAPLIGGPAYRVILPWKAAPSTQMIRILVRFTGMDGAVFEAERDAQVTPPGPRRPRPSPPMQPPSEQPPASFEPPLTPPAVLPPTATLSAPTTVLGDAPLIQGQPRRPGSRRNQAVLVPEQPLPAPTAPPLPSSLPPLPPPPPLQVPLDPPLSFQMRPFSNPVVQAAFEEPLAPRDIRLEAPRPR